MDKLLDWLNDHDLISINRLEERAGIPQRVLSKALKGTRPLPEKYCKPLAKILKEYGYKTNNNPLLNKGTGDKTE